MAIIQILLNGQKTSVTKLQVFELAKQGKLKEHSPIWIDGKETVCGRIQGIVFGVEVPMPPVHANNTNPPDLQKPDFQKMINSKNKKTRPLAFVVSAIVLDSLLFLLFLWCTFSIVLYGISYKDYLNYSNLALQRYMDETSLFMDINLSNMQTMTDFDTIDVAEREQQKKDTAEFNERAEESMPSVREMLDKSSTKLHLREIQFKEYTIIMKEKKIKRLEKIIEDIRSKINERDKAIGAQIEEFEKSIKAEQKVRERLIDQLPVSLKFLLTPAILWTLMLLSVVAFILTMYTMVPLLRKE